MKATRTLALDCGYDGGSPEAHAPVTLEVGDRVVVEVEGPDEVRGRAFSCVVHSSWEETRKDGCKKVVTTHHCPNPCGRTYTARLFQHYFPVLNGPEGLLEVKGRRLSQVVRRAGTLTLVDLLVADATALHLPGREGGSVNALDEEAVRNAQNQLVAAGHKVVGVDGIAITPGRPPVRVRVVVERVD